MTTTHGHDAVDAGRSSTGRASRGADGFTLIEMLAVMAIIAVLVAMMVVIVNYVQRQMSVATAKSQIAALSAAIENYKSDIGYYPVSTLGHFSSTGVKEGSNNWLLYRALSGMSTGKRYMNFSASMLRSNSVIPQMVSGTTTSMCLGIFDPWGSLYNYYCSPTTTFAISNNVWDYPADANASKGYAVGGQVNLGSFDLLSYGPDKLTFVAPNLAYGSWSDGPWVNPGFAKTNSALDDVSNFKR